MPGQTYTTWEAKRCALALPLLLLLIAAMASRLWAQDVVLVRSSSAKPYEQTSKRIVGMLASQKRVAESVLLSKVTDGLMTRWLAAASKPVFVAIGSKAAVMLKDRLPQPVTLAYCMVARPEEVGLTGPRLTHGVGMQVPFAVQLALIRKSLPGCRRIGMMCHADDSRSKSAVARVRQRLPAGWSLDVVTMSRRMPSAKAIEDLLARRVDLVLTSPSAAVYGPASVKALLVKSLRARVPVFGYSRSFVRAGALLGVGVDLQAHGRQTAQLVAELLDRTAGAPPPKVGTLRPPEAAVSINLIVANRIGITLPAAAVADARYVIREEK